MLKIHDAFTIISNSNVHCDVTKVSQGVIQLDSVFMVSDFNSKSIISVGQFESFPKNRSLI